MPRTYTNHSLNRQRIFDFVLQFQQKKHYSPTIREICAATGICSTSTVHGHVCRMIRDGLLTQANSKPRTLCAVPAIQLEANHG
jgi:repressor LexA